MAETNRIRRFISDKAARFEESVIRRMTQVCLSHGGVNLAQGFPDFPAPAELQDAACQAIRDGYNQYARTWGAPAMVDALAEKVRWFQGMDIDPARQTTICCGTTEAMIAALLATINPGDEVVVTSPFYENYGADTILCGATPRYVTLHPTPDGSFRFDLDELRDAFNPRTRGIIVNTPNNPTGKVYSRDDLAFIAELCIKHDVLAFTDEIYEHILYDGREHIALATLPGMADRTITIGGLSKTYSVTGWRVAWAIASAEITAAIRKVHDFLTVGAPHPMQIAGAAALRMPRGFYDRLAEEYGRRRTLMWEALRDAGFEGFYPEGAYYMMVNIDRFKRAGEDDTDFALRLVKEAGVATVPGSSFYNPPSLGHHLIRFCFCKKDETLRDAGHRLRKWSSAQ
ncbi:MAG: aminotransferase class I/II-fold pyridoxal phosphate-dependent enzyme [Phycisphaerae bacterium]|nr:aminotransferase class I/II-fold pyridoxal phosphate-dependent enzyme [Phycisphaerae bacterium]